MSEKLRYYPDYYDLTTNTYNDPAAVESYINEYYKNLAKEKEGNKGKTFVQEWLERATAGLPPDARIFDVGSGAGQDADYLKKLGFENIVLSDAVEPFIEFLKQRFDDVRQLDIMREDVPTDGGGVRPYSGRCGFGPFPSRRGQIGAG
jgi:SAM-dependent methyltransferase